MTALCSQSALAFRHGFPGALPLLVAVPEPAEVGCSHHVPAALHHREVPVQCWQTENTNFPFRAALSFYYQTPGLAPQPLWVELLKFIDFPGRAGLRRA